MTMERQAENTTIEMKGDWIDEIEKGYNKYIDLGAEYYSKEKKKTIYKWPKQNVFTSSADSYRCPRMASFGPYHHGEEDLKPMEHLKERALYNILQRSGVTLTSLVSSLRVEEQELRSNYGDDLDDLNLPPDSFLRMMLLDGCFILELLRLAQSVKDPKPAEESYDHFLYMDGMLTTTVIRRDMLMLENQIPLLVLKKLLGVLKKREINGDELVKLIIELYRFKYYPNEICGPHLHILDVYRKCLLAHRRWYKTPLGICLDGLHFLSMVPYHMIVTISVLVYKLLGGRIPKPRHIRSAMRFHEAGIEFQNNTFSSGIGITFDKKNGVLHLPYINIEDHTEVIYMNLMAFEWMHPELRKERVVTSFVAFFCTLIDTAEDVSLLSSKGIVSNYLGRDEDAAKVFKKLGDCIVYIPKEERHKQLERYICRDWTAARAYVAHNYFRKPFTNPWSIVSLLGAIILLVLTFIQTVASVMGVHK